MSLPKRQKVDSGSSERHSTESEDDYRRKTTSFSDPTMGQHSIKLNEACVKIINTPQFHRLHHLKQTGASYLVYPSAKHARFEHSLGTCYWAGKVVRELRFNQPELGITDRDILVVEIAALCHDLGHGPFSHTFDQMFIPLARPGKDDWVHEEASVSMFFHMLKVNPELKKYLEALLDESDFRFIKEAIIPVDEENTSEWSYKGRPFEKAFLYDIVSNKSNGFDVDKWDYICRDGVLMSIPTNANLSRILDNIRVMNAGPRGRPTLCYRDKVKPDLTNLARTRAQLHASAYQHRTVKIIETMLVDALLLADQHIVVAGTNGNLVRLSETIDDMVAYARVNDNLVLSALEQSYSDELKPARAIYERIAKRNLYDKVGETQTSDPEKNERIKGGLSEDLSGAIANCLTEHEDAFPNVDKELLKASLAVMVADIHGGMKDTNPVEKVWFFKKDHTKPYRFSKKDLQTDAPPPRRKVIRVFSRDSNPELVSCAKCCFETWCRNNDLPHPQEITEDEFGSSQGFSSQPLSFTNNDA